MAEEEDSMKGTVNKIHSCLWTLDTMMMMMHTLPYSILNRSLIQQASSSVCSNDRSG